MEGWEERGMSRVFDSYVSEWMCGLQFNSTGEHARMSYALIYRSDPLK
jgi:hypothetical protein